MTRDQLVQIILGRCGNRIGSAFLREQTILELVLAQTNVLEKADFKPWFLESEYQHATVGALEPRMPLPTRFLAEPEEGMLWIRKPGTSKYSPVHRDDYDHLEEKYLDHAPSIPEGYAISKNYLVLFPTPDVAYPVKMRCYQKEPTFPGAYESADGSGTNLWMEHAAKWLIGEAGKVIAGSYLKDPATAAEFEKEAQAAKSMLYVDHVAREEMNRERSAGDD